MARYADSQQPCRASHADEPNPVPAGDVATAGHEQQGTRPVLIVTPAAFNRVTRLPVVVPVTSGGNFARTAGFAVSLDGVGIRTTGVVRCDQPRTIDMKARGGKRLERVPETIMNEVLGRLSTILT